MRKIYRELVAIRKELQAIRSRLELSKEEITSTAISDGVQKAVWSAIHDTDVKAEL